MIEKKPLVSICIPTFNRASCLEKFIKSIIIQNEFIENKVEIVISDNNSSDNTREVCEYYQKNYSNFKYYKNEENIGDKNFPFVLSKASGILRKLCNDTHCFLPGTLNFFCKVCTENITKKPVLFFSNIKKQEKKINLNIDSFMEDVSFYVTWIGSFAIWDEDCLDLMSDTEACGLNLWQVDNYCKNITKKKNASIYYYHFSNIQFVPKKNMSYGIFRVFHDNFLSIIKPYVSASVYDYNEKELLFGYFSPYLAQYKLMNKNIIFSETENLEQAISKFYSSKDYFKEFNSFFKKYYFAYKVKYRIKRFLGLFMTKYKYFY